MRSMIRKVRYRASAVWFVLSDPVTGAPLNMLSNRKALLSEEDSEEDIVVN